MKKIMLVLLLIVALVLPVMAAETMTISSRDDHTSDGSRLRSLDLLCTADTDGSFSYQLTDTMFDFVRGWLLTEVRVSNSTTQTDPTANSDIALRLVAGETFDLLHSAGDDSVDNDTVNSFPPLDSNGTRSVVYITDQFFVEVENNSISEAVFVVTLILFPTR